MRLSHPLINRPGFVFPDYQGVCSALKIVKGSAEFDEVVFLFERGLPPIADQKSLCTLLGVNPGFIWSIINRKSRHYSLFQVSKGNGVRAIAAPRVGLKIILKWLSCCFVEAIEPADHVYGFVKGRTHVDAARCHLAADWIASFDIVDFFSTTPVDLVELSLRSVGYSDSGAELIASLSTLDGFLPQGSPFSPTLSNLCLANVDRQLADLSRDLGVTLTRYADDIVFSGSGDVPEGLVERVSSIFSSTPWLLSDNKFSIIKSPQRLIVHGLLVSGDRVRLPKRLRNKIRALRHLRDRGGLRSDDFRSSLGLIAYSDFISG